MTNAHATLNEITTEHETELIDVSEQHSIDKVLFGDRYTNGRKMPEP